MSQNLEDLIDRLSALPHPAQDSAAQLLHRLLFAPPSRPGLSRREVAELNRRFGESDRVYAPLEQV